MTDMPDKPPVEVAIGADVTSFVSSIRTAMEQAKQEIEGLDTSQAEAKMDATLRKIANESVAYAQQYGKSIDAMILKLETAGIVADEVSTKLRVLMNQAASRTGMLTQQESLGVLLKQVDEITKVAASKMTQGFKTEYADIPAGELAAINAEMNASVAAAAKMFADTWGLAVNDVITLLKTQFSVLDQGLVTIIAKKPGTALADNLSSVIPITKEVEAEIARITGMIENLAAAKEMGGAAAMRTFGPQVKEAAATAGMDIRGAGSEELFGAGAGDVNRITIADKLINRLEAVRQAYINIGKAQGVAAAQVEKLSIPEVINTESLTLLSAKSDEVRGHIDGLNTELNNLKRSVAQTPDAEFVPKWNRQIKDLEAQIKSANVQLSELTLASRRVARGATPTTTLEDISRGVVIHPSSLLQSPEQMYERALQQALSNAGLSDVDAYVKAFEGAAATKRSEKVDLGSKHGKYMHDEVERGLAQGFNTLKIQGQDFEKDFATQWQGFNIKGTMDWVDSANNIITDFKAIGSKEWARLETALKTGDFSKLPVNLQRYVGQLESYGRAMQEVTKKPFTLRSMQLSSLEEIGGEGFGSARGAAAANVKQILAGTRPSVSWKAGTIIDDATLAQIMDVTKQNLIQEIMTPEVQMKRDLVMEAQELAKREAITQQQVNEKVAEQVRLEQQAGAAIKENVASKEAETAAAGGAGVPPGGPPPTIAAPEPMPEDTGAGAKRWEDLARGKTLEESYVASLTQERLLEEELANIIRSKVQQQAVLNDLKKQYEGVTRTEAETPAMYEARAAALKEEITRREEALRATNTEVSAEKSLLDLQQARTRELRAQVDLKARESKVSAGQISDPELIKLAEMSKKLSEMRGGDATRKDLKNATKDLERQLDVVKAIIAQDNVAAQKLKAISDLSASQLAIEKDKLIVLEKQAAAREAQYAKAVQAQGTAAPMPGSDITALEQQAKAAQAAVTAQQQLVTTTEMKARADAMATGEAQASVTAMRQQTTAAEGVNKAFGEAADKTNNWITKVFSLRHITSSFFGMFLSMIGYGIFGKIQEGMQKMVEESKRGEDALFALEGALKATQERAAEGVTFKVDPGTTVDKLVGGRKEMLAWVEEFRKKYAGIWSTADIEAAVANVMNLTRNLEMTKEEFRSLMDLSGVFSVIDADMQKNNNDIVKGSEYLARIVQGNIRNTAITAVGLIEPQQQAEKARQLGLQREWESLNKLSGAQAANLTKTVNLAIVQDRLGNRTEEVNRRLGTTAARYKEVAAAQEQYGQTSRIAQRWTQQSVELQETLSDLLQPKSAEQLAIRTVGKILSEFEQQVKEGRWGDISDAAYEQLSNALAARAMDFAKKSTFKDIFGQFEIQIPHKGINKFVDDFRNEFVDANGRMDYSSIAEKIVNDINNAMVNQKVTLPEIDYPEMADQLAEVTEKRLEDRSDALKNYFKNLRKNGEKYANDLIKFMQDHRDRLVEIADSYREKLLDIQDKVAESIVSANEDYQDKLADIEKKRQEDLLESSKKKRNDYLEAEIDHQRKLEDLVTDHFRKLKDINDKYLFDLDEAANQRNAREALRLVRQHKFDVAKENEAFQQRNADEALNYSRKLEDIARKQAEQRDKDKADYDKQLREAKEALDKKLAEIEKGRQKDIAEAEKDREKDVRKEDESYQRKKEQRLRQLAEENQQEANAFQERLNAIEADIDDQLRKIASGWQKKYKLDGDQLKLAYTQLLAYMGPNGYFKQVMDWWSVYVSKVPMFGTGTSTSTSIPGIPFMNYTPIPTTNYTPMPTSTPITPTTGGGGKKISEIPLKPWEIKITADEHFSEDFEDKVLDVMKGAMDAVRH